MTKNMNKQLEALAVISLSRKRYKAVVAVFGVYCAQVRYTN
jgi:hypothetical protein